MRRLVVLVAAGLIAGCVNQIAVRQAELTKWIGRPEVDLVQAMGVPTRTYETGGLKFLAYEERRVEIVPGSPYFVGPDPFWYGGYGGGFPPTAVTLVCATTFTIGDGVVRTFTLRGNACG
jgi:hypothetical protein